MTDLLYSCEEHETLHDSEHDAIEAHFDDLCSYGPSPTKWPRTITVHAHRRMTVRISRCNARFLVDEILDDLDDEYGDPDGTPSATTNTGAMLAAAQALIDTVIAGYTPWACERVRSYEVDTQAWLREHWPEMMA